MSRGASELGAAAVVAKSLIWSCEVSDLKGSKLSASVLTSSYMLFEKPLSLEFNIPNLAVSLRTSFALHKFTAHKPCTSHCNWNLPSAFAASTFPSLHAGICVDAWGPWWSQRGMIKSCTVPFNHGFFWLCICIFQALVMATGVKKIPFIVSVMWNLIACEQFRAHKQIAG